eukprot:TRINITY_DN27058_c0_g1_i1.p1 TRINITY_DN27058_c0_g1~~TRINITY_DN27058_c0_g1_i1.p1  ORF type:complete len:765 (-),score=170.96 TRINITY_DN27058_c0_g1_i1:372-2414(-)
MVRAVSEEAEETGGASSSSCTDPELARLRRGLEDLQAACRRKMAEAESRFPELSDLRRVRIISPLDLHPVLQSIKSRTRGNFKYWFQQTSYDTPKIVGAILRLRELNTAMPVLRFDEDVLFTSTTLADNMASIGDAVAKAVKTFRERGRGFWTQSWVFSAQYAPPPPPPDPGASSSSASSVESLRSRYVPWSQAFATRCTPALLATPALCAAEQFEDHEGEASADARGEGVEPWRPSDAALEEATDESVLLRFYGLRRSDVGQGLRPVAPSACPEAARRRDEDLRNLGIGYLGASPLRSCVSGAGLCVPPGLSLDLPPFTHFSLNVMWIDDHILQGLTREVEGLPPLLSGNDSGPSTGAAVVKARERPTACAWYTLEAYLPALLFGCIMDAWICGGSEAHLLKYALEDLPLEEAQLIQRWRQVRGAPFAAAEATGADPRCGVAPGPRGPLSAAVLEVLRRGRMLDREELRAFRVTLWAAALRRIREAYCQWSQLAGRPQSSSASPSTTTRNSASSAAPAADRADDDNAEVDTFAKLWATGGVASHGQLGLFCEAVPWASEEARSRSAARSRQVRSLRLGAGLVDPRWHGRAAAAAAAAVAAGRPASAATPPLSVADLNPHIAEAVATLVEETVAHLEWVLVWPAVVQAVRSVRAGRLPCDVAFGLASDSSATSTLPAARL